MTLKNNTIYNVSKTKYMEINLVSNVKDFYKILQTEIEDLNKWRVYTMLMYWET